MNIVPVKTQCTSHSVASAVRDDLRYDAVQMLQIIKEAREFSLKTNRTVESKHKSNAVAKYEGHVFKIWSLRYTTFLSNPLECCSCELKITHAYFEKQSPSNSKFHVNLYGTDVDGNEVLFTKDHINPKAHGGSDDPNNLITMCEICNAQKADSLITTLHPEEIS